MIFFEKEEESIQYWKNKVLKTLLLILFVFGLLAYIPSIIISIREQLVLVVILDTVALLFIVFLLLSKSIGYNLKSSLVMMCLYLLGMGLLIFLGPYGAGFVWLISFPIVTAILLNRNSAYLAILFNFISLVALGILMELGILEGYLVTDYARDVWIINSVNFLCLNIITVYPITVIVDHLKRKLHEEILTNSQKEEVVKKLEDNETKLKAKNQQLKKTNQELDNFIYRVSHNLRSPLSSILGLVQISKMEKDSVTRKQYLEYISKSALKLDRFIKELISFSRTSRSELSTQKISFQSLTDSVLEDLKYMKNFDKLTIRKEISENGEFCSDPYRLKVILSNLISNGIKYCYTNNRQPYMLIKINVEHKKAVIVVEDNGIGIQEDKLSKIFEMFYRSNESEDGAGLGLYIVQEALTVLKGQIEVQSTLNQGSQFNVVIPNLSCQGH